MNQISVPYYWKDPLAIQKIDLTVKNITNGKIIEVEEKIPFYQAGGGQPSDKITLFSERKPYKVKTFSDTTLELAKKSSIKVSGKVSLEVDVSFRKAVMRAHTCQHLVSALILNECNIATKKGVMKDDEAQIELESSINSKNLAKIILKVNQYIANSIPITSHIIDSERDQVEDAIDIQKIRGFVPKDKRYVRIVQIGEIDLNTCGGTHLTKTDEILSFFLVKAKNNILEFYCGFKALNFISNVNSDLLELWKFSQTQPEKIIPEATNRLNELQSSLKEFRTNSTKLLRTFFNVVYSEFIKKDVIPDSFPALNNKIQFWKIWKSATGLYLIFESGLERKSIMESVQVFAEIESMIILAVLDQLSIQIIALNPTTDLNALSVLELLKMEFNAKGGGSEKVAQVILPKSTNYKIKLPEILP